MNRPVRFVSVLRSPDYAYGATEASPYRFEEPLSAASDVKFDYTVAGNVARVTVYPSGSPVKLLKLRFEGDMHGIESVYGDQWERNGDRAFLEWRSVMPHRALGWFCYVKGGDRIACYGVKTGADCFAFWQVDVRGVTLVLNLCNGLGGTDLSEPLLACEVTEMVGEEGEDAYAVAKRFSARLCDRPVLPKEPIFGVNNWYWAYGNITRDTIRVETDQLLAMCEGADHRPYMIIDDGWQFNRTNPPDAYIGGPWIPSDRFGCMRETAEEIHAKGAKAGIWFRPLLTLGRTPKEAWLAKSSNGGTILDPTHPYTLERVEEDARRLREWGYDLIKHDFTTIDVFGVNPLSTELHTTTLCTSDRKFFDRTVTLATAIKRLYAAIARGAGNADVIACNAVGHLSAGIHSTYRTGNDTSGRSYEWTRKVGINTMMRLPLNDTFYRVDPDCAAFTEQVDADANLDFLEMCALTGVTTLASVTPGILTPAQMKRINEIYRIAGRDDCRYAIADYDRNASPDTFVSQRGDVRVFDWERIYHGARVQLSWMQ